MAWDHLIHIDGGFVNPKQVEAFESTGREGEYILHMASGKTLLTSGEDAVELSKKITGRTVTLNKIGL